MPPPQGGQGEAIVAISMTDRRQVGKTDLRVPALGFGAAHLGELYRLVDEADSRATLQAAWDGGIRFYDTAPWYGRGLSEHRMGGFLRTQKRADFVVSTKVGRVLHRPKDFASFSRAPWTGGLNYEVEFNYTYDGLMRAYEQTLMRLGLDTVDTLIIHDLDVAYHGDAFAGRQKDLVASGIKALEELKKAGDIKAIGMGINTTEAFETVGQSVDLDFALVAMPYTLLDQSSLHTGMANCIKRNMSVIIGAPFASGILVTGSGSNAKYGYANAPEAVQAKVRGIERVAAAHKVSVPAAALAFPLAHPAVVALIPGSVRPEEVQQNIASFHAPIPASFWSDLKSEGLIDKDAPTP